MDAEFSRFRLSLDIEIVSINISHSQELDLDFTVGQIREVILSFRGTEEIKRNVFIQLNDTTGY